MRKNPRTVLSWSVTFPVRAGYSQRNKRGYASGSLMKTMPIDASILTEIEHLRELGENERAALSEEIDLIRHTPGQIVFNYGDPGHALYIVRSGEVEIYIKNDQGEKIVLEISQPGDIFGEVSLLDDGPRTAWVAAVTDVELLRLDREHFEDYVRHYTPAALNLLSVAARRLRKSDDSSAVPSRAMSTTSQPSAGPC